MKIMFICTGNTCRSPMAELLLKNMLAPDSGVEVSSAGLAAGAQPISVNSLKVLGEIGIDAGYYVSRPAIIEEIKLADYVITMTPQQKIVLKSSIKNSDNVYTLAELTDGADVSDPFGTDLDSYRKTRESLIKMLKKLADKLGLPLNENAKKLATD